MDLSGVLRDFGFTEVESSVYIFLLQESPATGYRASQAVGRPLSQTYKAIESLSKKGAVMVDDGTTRLCRAVRPDDYLSQVQHTFEKRVQAAQQLFRRLPKQASDHRVYQIESFEEVVERTIRMLKRFSEVAIVDLFPAPLELFRTTIEKAFDRGKRIAVKTYEPSEVRATLKTVLSDGPGLMKIWPGEILNIVVDGSEFVSALIDVKKEQVRHAIWSSNPFLAARQHNGLCCEMGLTMIQDLLFRNAPKKELIATLKMLEPFYLRNSPGFIALSKSN